MLTVYPHDWKELASARATCVRRTIARTAVSPESPAVSREAGVVRRKEQRREDGRGQQESKTKQLGRGTLHITRRQEKEVGGSADQEKQAGGRHLSQGM